MVCLLVPLVLSLGLVVCLAVVSSARFSKRLRLLLREGRACSSSFFLLLFRFGSLISVHIFLSSLLS